MITEQPVIELLEVELLEPSEGFILGRSKLDEDYLGDADAPLNWVAYTGAALGVSGQRGGKRAGVVNTIDVGTLNVTLLNAGDPAVVAGMVPNATIRLRSKLSDRPLFTGTISDIDMTHTLDKTTAKVSTRVTLVIVDGVQAHANVTRYGAIAPDGFERWESRIQRLAESSNAPINPPVLNPPVVRYSL